MVGRRSLDQRRADRPAEPLGRHHRHLRSQGRRPEGPREPNRRRRSGGTAPGLAGSASPGRRAGGGTTGRSFSSRRHGLTRGNPHVCRHASGDRVSDTPPATVCPTRLRRTCCSQGRWLAFPHNDHDRHAAARTAGPGFGQRRVQWPRQPTQAAKAPLPRCPDRGCGAAGRRHRDAGRARRRAGCQSRSATTSRACRPCCPTPSWAATA